MVPLLDKSLVHAERIKILIPSFTYTQKKAFLAMFLAIVVKITNKTIKSRNGNLLCPFNIILFIFKNNLIPTNVKVFFIIEQKNRVKNVKKIREA